MRIATLLSYAGGFKEAVAEVKALEKAGLDVVWVPEAYSFDAPSAMGYIAAETERVTIASGILPIYTRTPSLPRHDSGRHRLPFRRTRNARIGSIRAPRL
jgi:hypothetical protein